MPLVTEENLSEIGDLEGISTIFYTNGFDVEALITMLKSKEWISSNSLFSSFLKKPRRIISSEVFIEIDFSFYTVFTLSNKDMFSPQNINSKK